MNNVLKKQRGRPRKDAEAVGADRRSMIDAAVAVLDEGGPAAFSARAVAERAGVAVGSVYAQFDGLEALRLEANVVTMRRLRRALTAALEACAGLSLEDRLLGIADAYLAFAADHRNAWAALFERRTMEAPPELASDIAGLFALLEDLLRPAAPPDRTDIPTLARALWSSVHGMAFLGEVGGLGPIRAADVPIMVRALVGAVLQGLMSGRAP